MKSDKELAVELTAAFMQAWNHKDSTKPIDTDDCAEILKQFYQEISDLGTESSD